ncbi:MAG: hypothetical protein FJ088_14070 [Deltaproteobacteria bacterium]|nr:hypothetical protein [Deltaproteobacteria bacterium]
MKDKIEKVKSYLKESKEKFQQLPTEGRKVFDTVSGKVKSKQDEGFKKLYEMTSQFTPKDLYEKFGQTKLNELFDKCKSQDFQKYWESFKDEILCKLGLASLDDLNKLQSELNKVSKELNKVKDDSKKHSETHKMLKEEIKNLKKGTK